MKCAIGNLFLPGSSAIGQMPSDQGIFVLVLTLTLTLIITLTYLHLTCKLL